MQTAYSLANVAHGGVLNEDVLQQVFDISPTSLPLQERIGSESTSNPYTSWRIRDLAAPDPTSAEIDGSDSVADDTRVGTRVGNFHHIKRKKVKTSTLADASDTIGYSVEHTDQIMERQKELRRDVEAAKLYINPSREDDGSAVAGLSASISSWLTSNTNRGTAGADGGFGTTTPNIVDAPTPGNARAGTETMVRDMCEDIYTGGGDPTIAMGIPKLIRRLSEYMFTASARIATLQSDTGQRAAAATAKGAVNVFLTDHDVVLEMIPNRNMTTYTDAVATQVADLHILSPSFLREGILHGYRSDPLGKTGLSETSEITVAFTLKVLNEAAHGVISDLDPELAFTS